uniref:Structural molecule n=2 Tax=Rhizophora mucronata TaxID=61149 RepID=A0A2P2LZ02_RHIMU
MNSSIASLTLFPVEMAESSFCLGIIFFCKTNVVPLLPLEIRRFPDGDKYVVSNQPFTSSPRSLNGTGYGTLNGKKLNVKVPLSNQKWIRFPLPIDAAAS